MWRICAQAFSERISVPCSACSLWTPCCCLGSAGLLRALVLSSGRLLHLTSLTEELTEEKCKMLHFINSPWSVAWVMLVLRHTGFFWCLHAELNGNIFEYSYGFAVPVTWVTVILLPKKEGLIALVLGRWLTHTHMCLKSLKQDQNSFFAIPKGSKVRSDVMCWLQPSPVRSLLPPVFLIALCCLPCRGCSLWDWLACWCTISNLAYLKQLFFKSMSFWEDALCVRGLSRHAAEGSSDLLTLFSCS